MKEALNIFFEKQTSRIVLKLFTTEYFLKKIFGEIFKDSLKVIPGEFCEDIHGANSGRIYRKFYKAVPAEVS